MDLAEALAKLATTESELATVREKLTEANGEAKHHRLSAQAYRTQTEELRTALSGKDDEIKTVRANAETDAEKLRIDLTGRATAAEKAATAAAEKAAERSRAAELRMAAKDAGLVDMDGLKLLDHTALKLNADGDIENAPEVLAAMKTAKPYLFGTAFATGTTSSTSAPPPPNTGTPKRAVDMTPDERAAGARALGINVIRN